MKHNTFKLSAFGASISILVATSLGLTSPAKAQVLSIGDQLNLNASFQLNFAGLPTLPDTDGGPGSLVGGNLVTGELAGGADGLFDVYWAPSDLPDGAVTADNRVLDCIGPIDCNPVTPSTGTGTIGFGNSSPVYDGVTGGTVTSLTNFDGNTFPELTEVNSTVLGGSNFFEAVDILNDLTFVYSVESVDLIEVNPSPTVPGASIPLGNFNFGLSGKVAVYDTSGAPVLIETQETSLAFTGQDLFDCNSATEVGCPSNSDPVGRDGVTNITTGSWSITTLTENNDGMKTPESSTTAGLVATLFAGLLFKKKQKKSNC